MNSGWERLKQRLPEVVMFVYVVILLLVTYAELTEKSWFDWLSLTQH